MQSDVEALLKKGTEGHGVHPETQATPKSAPAKETETTAPAVNKINIFLAALSAMALFIAGAYVYRTLLQETPPPTQITIPAPFFAIESSRTITYLVNTQKRTSLSDILKDTAREKERPGSIKRVVVKIQDDKTEKLMDLKDFFTLMMVEPPPFFFNPIEQPLMVFIHYGSDGPRLGWLTKVSNAEMAFRNLLGWEAKMPSPLKPLLLEESSIPSEAIFEDRTYRNIGWRFFRASTEKDLGVAYSVFPAGKYLILTTNKESMERVIDRLFDAL